MIHALYKFYSDSSVRYDKLRDLQTLLYGKAKQITEPTSVRLLSVESAVKMVYQSYDAIVLSLGADKDGGKAEGLYRFLTNSLFVLITALLIDVLTVISVLSLTFQKDSVNMSCIKHSVTATKATLSSMKNVLSDLGDTPEPGQKNSYKGIELTDNGPMRDRFVHVRDTYLTTLIQNLEDRFPDDALQVIECLDLILNPSRYPDDYVQLNTYGAEQLTALCDQYSNVDREKAMANFLQFKHVARSYKNILNFDNFAKLLINEFNTQYPEFCTFAKIALIIPVSSAPCERGFSVQNALKTKVRNRLSPERLNRLMFIKLVGPNIESFDFLSAARMFYRMKDRVN